MLMFDGFTGYLTDGEGTYWRLTVKCLIAENSYCMYYSRVSKELVKY